ncbi:MULTISPECIES: hypothetical protein [Lachnospiraceae]|nr:MULTISPECIES: hypothetical protein [Lachnospiraceae]
MKRRLSFQEKLSRAFCDKQDLNRKALKIKRSLGEINELLGKMSK